jgi:prolyl-tRNA synthetase
MRTTDLILTTRRDVAADLKLASDQLITKAGMVQKHGSGLFTYSPLGLRQLNQFTELVRSSISSTGAAEISMPFVQPGALWVESGRWDKMGDEMARLSDRSGADLILSPTHEEIIVDFARHAVSSYRDLPRCYFQIGRKFRDEVRPRFGLLRAREFLMMDAYSFDIDRAGLNVSYERMSSAYSDMFNTLGLDWVIVTAQSGDMGGTESQEFHVVANAGEDDLLVCLECREGWNVEVAPSQIREGSPCPTCGAQIARRRGIEVGHIFKLGATYSRSMGFTVATAKDSACSPEMGCYGIGVSRLMAAAVEQLSTESTMTWPKGLAPFDVAVIPVRLEDEVQSSTAETIYRQLSAAGAKVVIDDRPGLRFGAKVADMELIGIPNRVIVGRDAGSGRVELQRSGSDAVTIETATVTAQVLRPA